MANKEKHVYTYQHEGVTSTKEYASLEPALKQAVRDFKGGRHVPLHIDVPANGEEPAMRVSMNELHGYCRDAIRTEG